MPRAKYMSTKMSSKSQERIDLGGIRVSVVFSSTEASIFAA